MGEKSASERHPAAPEAGAQHRGQWTLAAGFVVLAMLIGAAGYLIWQQQADSIRAQAEASLNAVAKLKADQLTTWAGERRGDAEVISGDVLLADATAGLAAARADAATQAAVQRRLAAIQRDGGYAEVILVSASGAILARAPLAAHGPPGVRAVALAAAAVRTRSLQSSDLYLGPGGRARLDTAAPLSPTRPGAPSPGAMILRTDPSRFLYPFIQSWPLPNRSGETLLVERRGDRVLYLNELRFRHGTALTLSAPMSTAELPAAMAIRGRTGIVQGVDYRGVLVLAAAQPVRGTAWFVIAKLDTSEVLGPVRTRSMVTAVVAVLLVALAGVATLLVWREREVRAAAALAASHSSFRTLFENMTEGVGTHELVYDAAGAPVDYRVLDVNPAFSTQTGMRPEDVLGRLATEAYGATAPPFIERYAQSVANQEAQRFTPFLDVLDRYFDIAVIPQGGARFATIFEDVTERKRAEEALRDSEATLRAVLDATPFPVALVDERDDTIELWSRSALTLFGHTAPTAAEWYELAYPDPAYRRQVVERWKPHLEEARRTGQTVNTGEYRVTCRDGSVRICELYATFLTDRLVVTFDDLTERKRADDALHESEERFKYVFEHSPIGKSITQPGGEISVNAAFYDMLGYTREELEHTRWQDLTPPEDIEPTEAKIALLLSGKADSTRFVKRYLHKDGLIVWADVSTSLRRDEAGAPLYFITAVLDITQQKAAEDEIATLNARLEQRVADRTAQLDAANKELEAFAYSVSHDLRAPLRHISGFSALLAERLGDDLDEESRHYLDTISRSVREMGILIDDLLQFSRSGRTELKIEPVDMDATLAEALEPLRRETGDRQIDWSIEPLPAVVADHALIRQVWANLLGNAVKFTRQEEPAVIEVGARSDDETNEIVFWVRDNGVGFDMQYTHKLFGVFQRLHSASQFEGTGIGLANVQRIIARLGGRVWAEGDLDRGATFSFSLPRRKGTAS